MKRGKRSCDFNFQVSSLNEGETKTRDLKRIFTETHFVSLCVIARETSPNQEPRMLHARIWTVQTNEIPESTRDRIGHGVYYYSERSTVAFRATLLQASDSIPVNPHF